MARCLYSDSFVRFIKADVNAVVGQLHCNYHGDALTTTNEAWKGEVELLQTVLAPWQNEDAEIIFEYDIPRLGKRIDVVLLLRGIIFCLEFKVGQKDALQADVDQVMDYALDLKNFHKFSYNDDIYNPLISGADGLQSLITKVLLRENTPSGTIANWVISPYKPTPTIVEAARALYENHSVEDITRHEADNVSTDRTINYILSIIEQSKNSGQKSICFVTGVPGAGKTLVGLDVAIKQTCKDKENGAVYLSGNGPLVAVLTEALARNNVEKSKIRGERRNKSDAERDVRKFIQVIHRYRENMILKIKNPIENGVVEIDPEKSIKVDEKSGHAEVEHVAIFDEAQRSWTHKRIADYLKRGGTYGNKTKVADFPMSEAEFLIWSLDQRKDWATIVCLVGGGQEINTGEAGIAEWIAALNNRFQHWQVFISDKLTEPEYAEGRVNELLQNNPKVTFANDLHLSVSLRSFRAEKLSAFVHSMLSFNTDATLLYNEIQNRNYPIVLTRDINKAREWLRDKARGNEHTGLLVTKVAARFKPLAVSVLQQGDENAIHWFLEDKTDVRSSNYLEDAATEIQVQGLELDYTCVLWDADMRCNNNKWTFYKFSNTTSKWSPESNEENRKYALNAYRVLLTRARQGMVICVPYGNEKKNADGFPEDPTRLPEFYKGTYNYLKSLGLKEL